MTVHAQKPTLGRIVHYRSRTGHYTLAAIVSATVDTLHMPGVESVHVEPLTDDMHVHLAVLSPARPGTSSGAALAGDRPASPNVGGTYQESDVPFDETGQEPGSWSWPPRV